MAIKPSRRNTLYARGANRIGAPMDPIILNRPPTTNDKASIGQILIDKANQHFYILGNITNGDAQWLTLAENLGQFQEIVATTGDITAQEGNVVVEDGHYLLPNDIQITQGAGEPDANLPVGSLYIRTDPNNNDERLYIKAAAGGGAENWRFISTNVIN